MQIELSSIKSSCFLMAFSGNMDMCNAISTLVVALQSTFQGVSFSVEH